MWFEWCNQELYSLWNWNLHSWMTLLESVAVLGSVDWSILSGIAGNNLTSLPSWYLYKFKWLIYRPIHKYIFAYGDSTAFSLKNGLGVSMQSQIEESDRDPLANEYNLDIIFSLLLIWITKICRHRRTYLYKLRSFPISILLMQDSAFTYLVGTRLPLIRKSTEYNAPH